MNNFNLLTEIIVEGLQPLEANKDEVEEKRLKEKDEKAMVVECLHHSTITHTTGSVECLRCHKMLKVIEPRWREKE